MAKYPELKGAPSKCLSTSPMSIDALKIRAPYGKTDKAVIEQAGIVSVSWPQVDGRSAWDVFNGFWQGKDQDDDKGVGWQSGAEMMTLDKMGALGESLVNKNAKYEAKARPKIVSLANAALAQLNFIASEYKRWDGIAFPGKQGYAQFQPLSLFRTESEIRSMTGNKEQIWAAQRIDSRRKIQQAWDKALRFLWCAVYAANQSKAYLKNQELSMQGVVLKAPPTQVNIKAAKSIPAVSVKKVTLIPTTEEPEFQPGMPEEPEEEIVEEEEIIEEKPKKKKNTGLLIAGAAAVALLAMKK